MGPEYVLLLHLDIEDFEDWFLTLWGSNELGLYRLNWIFKVGPVSYHYEIRRILLRL